MRGPVSSSPMAGIAALTIAAVSGLVSGAAISPTNSPARNSVWMARSLMARREGIMTGEGGSSEPLQCGFTQKSFTALLAQYPDEYPDVSAYLRESAESIAPYMLNASADAAEYPLDRLSNGNALLAFSQQDDKSSQGAHNASSLLGAAAHQLRRSIDLNIRNAEGGLQYYVYPYWSYLDGMYSVAPFYTLYSTTTCSKDNQTALDDMQHQMDLLWQHNHHAATGLLVHGYDFSRTAVWADPDTGASPHVWGRALGWFLMALVDTAELLSEQGYPDRQARLLAMYGELVPGLLGLVDDETGGWWQVLDQAGREGNYVETSATAMFSYALLKGARLGYLPDGEGEASADEVRGMATRAMGYVTDNFLVPEDDGTVGYDGTVAVCSLNSTATYEYYIGQPIEYNNPLGSNAYILASLEVEHLQQM